MTTLNPHSAGLRGFQHALRASVLFLLLAPLSGCVTNGTGDVVELGLTTFPFDQEESPYDIFTEYLLAPGDVLDVLYQIKTWQEQDEFFLAVDHTVAVKFANLPELNEEQFVRPDGTISLPYIGQVYVVGKTVEQLVRRHQAQQAQQHHDGQRHHVHAHDLGDEQRDGDGQHDQHQHHVGGQCQAGFHRSAPGPGGL